MISYPTYGFNLGVFFLTTFPVDSFFYFLKVRAHQKEEEAEKQHKKDEKKKFVKGLDPSKLAPLQRRKSH
jgi:hypothetical protein